MPDQHTATRIDDLSKDDLLKLTADFFHRIIVHYALWFTEVRRQMGMDKALEMLDAASAKSLGLRRTYFEDDGALVFEMNVCRVQAARQKKGLADYPCKSAGLVEYSYFATGIDPRIRTECIGCPPDPHPEDWFCAWRFTMS